MKKDERRLPKDRSGWRHPWASFARRPGRQPALSEAEGASGPTQARLVRILLRGRRLRLPSRTVLLGHLPVNGEFPVGIRLPPAAPVRYRETIVRRGILWFQLDRGFKRRNRFRILFD